MYLLFAAQPLPSDSGGTGEGANSGVARAGQGLGVQGSGCVVWVLRAS